MRIYFKSKYAIIILIVSFTIIFNYIYLIAEKQIELTNYDPKQYLLTIKYDYFDISDEIKFTYLYEQNYRRIPFIEISELTQEDFKKITKEFWLLISMQDKTCKLADENDISQVSLATSPKLVFQKFPIFDSLYRINIMKVNIGYSTEELQTLITKSCVNNFDLSKSKSYRLVPYKN